MERELDKPVSLVLILLDTSKRTICIYPTISITFMKSMELLKAQKESLELIVYVMYTDMCTGIWSKGLKSDVFQIYL